MTRASIVQHRNRLPHRQQDGATYFVTFRLADSLPRALLEEWDAEREAWLRSNPPPLSAEQEKMLQARFSSRMEHWLDQAHGSCLLRDLMYSQIVAGVLHRFDRERDVHHAWVVMCNHLHALFSLSSGQTLPKTLQGWKGVSSREVNTACGYRGPLWQQDYFDRMVRDTQHFWRCARYIRLNPAKAGLKQDEFIIYESAKVKAVLDGEATLLSP